MNLLGINMKYLTYIFIAGLMLLVLACGVSTEDNYATAKAIQKTWAPTATSVPPTATPEPKPQKPAVKFVTFGFDVFYPGKTRFYAFKVEKYSGCGGLTRLIPKLDMPGKGAYYLVAQLGSEDACNDLIKDLNKPKNLKDAEGSCEYEACYRYEVPLGSDSQLGGNQVDPDINYNGSTLVFASDHENTRGNYDIYISSFQELNPRRNRLIRLTTGASQDIHPVWSPDGSRIAFSSNRDNGNYDIYVMDSNGSNVTRLTSGPNQDIFPAWGFAGRTILYASDTNDNLTELHVIDVHSDDITLIREADSKKLYPSFSPDYEYIVYVNQIQDYTGLETSSEANVVYFIRSDGTDIRQPYLTEPVRNQSDVISYTYDLASFYEGDKPEFPYDRDFFIDSAIPHPVWGPNNEFLIYYSINNADPVHLNWRDRAYVEFFPDGINIGSELITEMFDGGGDVINGQGGMKLGHGDSIDSLKWSLYNYSDETIKILRVYVSFPNGDPVPYFFVENNKPVSFTESTEPLINQNGSQYVSPGESASLDYFFRKGNVGGSRQFDDVYDYHWVWVFETETQGTIKCTFKWDTSKECTITRH